MAMVSQLPGVHPCGRAQGGCMTTSTVRKKEPRDLLSAGQAADVLGVHPDTLRRWAAGGLLSVYRVGPRRDRRFHRSEIVRLMTRG